MAVKGLGMGGSERLIAEGARFWDRDRFDYQVAYLLPWKNQLAPGLEKLDVPVHLLGEKRTSTLGAGIELRSLCRRTDPALVHTHSPLLGVAARLLIGRPLMHTEHNLASSYHPLTRTANRLTYWRNRAVIAVSDAVAESLSGYPGPTPIVVPSGVDVSVSPEAVSVARRELGLDTDTPLVVHVGNIRPGKGHDVLVDTAELLVSRRPGVRVVSIGVEKHEGGLKRLHDEVRSRGLEDHVSLLGSRDDALAFIAAADVYVNPSQVEGLPVAVLEAMALARPIVATAVGGVPSLIRTGETGILVDADDASSMAAAVERILDTPEEGRRLGEAARKLVEQRHGLESMVRAIEALYSKILDV